MARAAENSTSSPCLRELQERFDHLRADLTTQLAASSTRKKAAQRTSVAAKHRLSKHSVAASASVEQRHAAVERKPRSVCPALQHVNRDFRAGAYTCTAPILLLFLADSKPRSRLRTSQENRALSENETKAQLKQSPPVWVDILPAAAEQQKAPERPKRRQKLRKQQWKNDFAGKSRILTPLCTCHQAASHEHHPKPVMQASTWGAASLWPLVGLAGVTGCKCRCELLVPRGSRRFRALLHLSLIHI